MNESKTPVCEKRERPFELEANPTMRGLNIGRNVVCGANDREFVGRARDGRELPFCSPVRNRRIRGEVHDRIQPRKLAELELLTLP